MNESSFLTTSLAACINILDTCYLHRYKISYCCPALYFSNFVIVLLTICWSFLSIHYLFPYFDVFFMSSLYIYISTIYLIVAYKYSFPISSMFFFLILAHVSLAREKNLIWCSPFYSNLIIYSLPLASDHWGLNWVLYLEVFLLCFSQ